MKRKLLFLITLLFVVSLTFSQALDEDFESGTWPPVGWTEQQLGDAAGWQESTARANSPTHSAFHNDDDVTSGCDDWLITPVMDLSSYTTPQFTYWENVNYGSYADEHNVMYSVDYSGSGDPTVATWVTINNTIGTEDTWVELGPYTLPTSATVYVAFQYIGDYASEWWVDDVLVQEAPSCPAPTAQNELNTTLNSSDLGWTAGGSEDHWSIEWKSGADFTPGTGAEDGSASISGSPTYALTGLTASTTYYWYVQADCGSSGGTGQSAWTGESHFTTLDGKAVNPVPADGASGVSVTSTTLDWDDVTGADGYHISVGTTTGGTDIVNNVAITGVTNSTYTVTSNWSYSTTYYWTVTTDYNSGSNVVGDEWDFSTDAAPISSYPATEDFESFTTNTNATGYANNWSTSPANTTSAFRWNVDSGETPSSSTGPLVDHTVGDATGKYLFTESSSGSENDEAYVYSPLYNLTGLTSPQLDFWYHMYGATMGDMHVDIDKGTGWILDVMSPALSGQQQAAQDDAWIKATVSLSAYVGETVKFRFRGIRGSGYTGDMAIDDVVVKEAPTCPAPTGQTATPAITTAQLNWTENGSATTWDIELGTDGFTPTGTPTSVGITKPYDTTGLTINTAYDWYVRSDCGSDWTGPHSFSTTDGKAVNPTPADGASDVLVSATTLDWDDVSGATSYTVDIGTTLGGNDIVDDGPAANSDYTYASNWDYGTQYYWTVNTVYNGTNDTVAGSEWDFSTECGTYTSPYSQDFNGTYVPLCWYEATGDVPTPTAGSSSWGQSNNFANASGNSKGVKMNVYSTDNDWLISPEIDLGTGGKRVTYKVAATTYNGTSSVSMAAEDHVYVMIKQSSGTWDLANALVEYTDGNTPSNTGDDVSIELTGWTGVVNLAFYTKGAGTSPDMDIHFDDFVVEDTPSCPNPTDQTETNITLNSADLGWTAGGSEDHWAIEWKAGSDFTPGTGAEDGSASISGSPTYALTGLTASTTYYWYVQADCGSSGGTGQSSWTGESNFTTLDGIASNPSPADGASGIAVTAKTFDWDDVTGASSYTIDIGTATGLSDIVNDGACASSTYTYSGADWDYSEDYFWTVTTVYSGGTAEGNEWDFFTECATVSSFPYTESFETGVPATCWTQEIVNDQGTDPVWSQETSTSHPSGGNPVDGSNIARFNSYSCPDNSSARLISPSFDFTGLTGMAMSFWMYHDDGYSTTPLEGVKIQASTDGTTWTDITGSLIERYSSAGDAWAKHTVDLSVYDGQTVQIAILGQSDYGNDSYIDMLTVHNNEPATATWTGTTDNNWSDAGNWNTSDIPYPTTDVTIPTGLTNYPTIVAAEECNNITIKSDVTGDGSLVGTQYLTVNGTTTVERYIPDGNSWHNIASPVDGATLAVLYSNNFNVYVEEYTESTDSWAYVTDLATAFPFGKGFSYALASGNTNTVEFQGALRTTDLDLNGASTPPIEFTSAPDKGYNFVGNPYTSAIQWGVGTWGLTNMNDQVWVWEHSPAGGGTYKDYVPGTGGSLTNGVIPFGQGFFVQANAASPSISIPMDAQVHSNQAYYKPSRENDPPHLVVTVNKEERSDEVWIAFREGATEGYLNGYDGRKLFGSEESPQLYTVEEGENLSIDALPPLELNKTRVVPLFFDAGETGEQTMVADLSELEYTDVLLEDLYLNVTQSLNDNPVYIFHSTYYQNPDRFRLHFTQTATGIGEDLVNAPRVYSVDNAIYIESSGKLAEIVKDVEVIDMYGRTVLRTKAAASSLVRIPMSVNNAYFVVRLIADSEIYTSKVFIK